jgi:hypothetical protein
LDRGVALPEWLHSNQDAGRASVLDNERADPHGDSVIARDGQVQARHVAYSN